MKKIPIIGLLIGAIAAMFAMKKKKGSGSEEEAASTEEPSGESAST